jgi:co-chaperonin GroES (HSP10)
MMTNKSGIHPQGHAVLCEPFEPEMMSSVIAIPDTIRQSLAILENRMIVVEIGGSAWDDEKAPRAKIGDVVICTKHAGAVVTGADGKMYRMVNGRDIYCTLDREAFAKAQEAA